MLKWIKAWFSQVWSSSASTSSKRKYRDNTDIPNTSKRLKSAHDTLFITCRHNQFCFWNPIARATIQLAKYQLYHGPDSDAILTTIHQSPLTFHSFQTLQWKRWINDEVINCRLVMLQQLTTTCRIYSTYFYTQLMSEGYCQYANVKHYTTVTQIDLQEYRKILIPIHKNKNHWALVVIDQEQHTLEYFDSLISEDQETAREQSQRCLENVATYYVREMSEKYQREIDIEAWTTLFNMDLPVQSNDWDCGLFMLLFVECIVRGYSQFFERAFQQRDMDHIRLHLATLLLEAELRGK